MFSSLISYFSLQIIETLVVCGCLVFGYVVIQRQFRPKTWETLPAEILEMIVQRLTIGDRIRVSNVSETWRSVAMQRDIPSAPHQLPWLLIPQACNQYLSFFDLCDGKVGKLDLPEQVRGGWFLGSSKGWLIIVKEDDLKSTMFLVNPISGTQHQIPPLSTIPSFQKYVETTKWKRYGGLGFCNCIALSTSDVTSCMVAATFDDDDETLCLCRPGDETWSIFKVLDTNDSCVDLLFSSGMLYALVLSNNKNGIATSPRTLSFRDHAVELKLVFDHTVNYAADLEDYDDYQIDLTDTVKSHLLESTTNEVLLIHEISDLFLRRDDAGNDHEDGSGNEEEDDNVYVNNNDDGNEEENNLGGNFHIQRVDEEYSDLNPYTRISGFEVYKLDPTNDRIVPVECLKDQLLFLSDTGSLSLPARDIKGLLGNCIYFATNRIPSFHSLQTYISREIGVFCFNKRRIQRSFPSVEVSIRSQLSWFSPSLQGQK